jgi:prepilin-type processing-associated H-X9-DG protein/prepilin-type N-terminal cleavage/methylation domain-containing protein
MQVFNGLGAPASLPAGVERMRRQSRAAFTLVELLVVIAVIAVLASLLLPALAKAKKRARATQCLSNLKQLGIGMRIYADENEGIVQLDGFVTSTNSWATILNTNINLRSLNVFLCPDYKPFLWENWHNVYGIRGDPPTNCASGPRKVLFKPDCVDLPAEYLFLADTTSQGQKGNTARQYYIFNAADALRVVHARHNGKANGLFLDGHVESCGPPRLESLGITAEYGSDAVVGYF